MSPTEETPASTWVQIRKLLVSNKSRLNFSVPVGKLNNPFVITCRFMISDEPRSDSLGPRISLMYDRKTWTNLITPIAATPYRQPIPKVPIWTRPSRRRRSDMKIKWEARSHLELMNLANWISKLMNLAFGSCYCVFWVYVRTWPLFLLFQLYLYLLLLLLLFYFLAADLDYNSSENYNSTSK